MPAWHEKRWLFWGFVGAFIVIALFIIVPNMPWIKPEIIENGKVLRSEQGRCDVQTESDWVLVVESCGSKNVGDTVKVRYRSESKIGDLAE